MDGTLVVAIVAVILAAGSILVAAVSLRQSMLGKQTDIAIRAEQRKQEALGILRQAQLSTEVSLRSYRNLLVRIEEIVHLADRLDETSQEIARAAGEETTMGARELIEKTEETIREFGNAIKHIEEMKPPGDKYEESYLVRLEANIGHAEATRLLAEHSRAMLDERIKSVTKKIPETSQ